VDTGKWGIKGQKKDARRRLAESVVAAHKAIGSQARGH